MLSIKQLKNLYLEFVLITNYEITRDPVISTLVKWLSYHIIKGNKKEANRIYNELIEETVKANNDDITNTTNDSL